MFDTLLYHLKSPYHFVKTGLLEGFVSQIKTGFPERKLKFYCLTGTDGKTTSSTLLYQVLTAAGRKVALVSTVAAYIGTEKIDTGFHVTTPDPRALYQLFARLVRQGYDSVVLEATSHGIYQHRLWGIRPEIVGLTNITHEHLDYHVSYQLYVQAKATLAKKAKTIIINADDESYGPLKKELIHEAKKLQTFSKSDVLPKSVDQAIKKRFPEDYNQMNARLVYLMSQVAGVTDTAFCVAVKKFAGVPGRMELAGEKNNVQVYVDFAHTPNALENVLLALRVRNAKVHPKGRLIAVFGCTGERDRRKRPKMGLIGSTIADVAIFTADDTRSEDVWSIIRQMKEGLTTTLAKVISIPDRRTAIEWAIHKVAQPGDVIALLGKGHEQTILHGRTEHPWGDVRVATEVLKSWGKI